MNTGFYIRTSGAEGYREISADDLLPLAKDKRARQTLFQGDGGQFQADNAQMGPISGGTRNNARFQGGRYGGLLRL